MNFQKIIRKLMNKHPHLALHIEKACHNDPVEWFNHADRNHDHQLSKEEFIQAIEEVDKKLKTLPSTAQVAHQQGEWLAKYLNMLGKISPDGTKDDSVNIKPFEYKHHGQIVSIGQGRAGGEFPLIGTLNGYIIGWIWRTYFLLHLASFRSQVAVTSDFIKSNIFGRDTSQLDTSIPIKTPQEIRK